MFYLVGSVTDCNFVLICVLSSLDLAKIEMLKYNKKYFALLFCTFLLFSLSFQACILEYTIEPIFTSSNPLRNELIIGVICDLVCMLAISTLLVQEVRELRALRASSSQHMGHLFSYYQTTGETGALSVKMPLPDSRVTSQELP
mmetsp:Transcript_20301/g.14981  ORF Transcript_20301/g.14981 Transcript_20301/m.14981 type:complete len:144 (+) Transcript_20301:84-515(+)